MSDEEILIKTSIIDYLEPINGGISVLVSITLYEYSFQCIYWFHPEGHYFLECEDDFLRLWGEEDTLNLPFYTELCKDIESILPDKNLLYDELLKN